MKKEIISDRQIKKGAGVSTLWVCMVVAMITLVLFVAAVLLFPTVWGMSAGSSKVFMIATFIVIPFVLFGFPVILYSYGYNSKKLQRDYLMDRILREKALIRIYEESMGQLRDIMLKNLEVTKKELQSFQVKENLSWDETKQFIIEDGKRMIQKINDDFEKVEESSDQDFLELISLREQKDLIIEKLEEAILNSIDNIRGSKQAIPMEYQKTLETIASDYDEIVNQHAEKMSEKINSSRITLDALSEKLNIYKVQG